MAHSDHVQRLQRPRPVRDEDGCFVLFGTWVLFVFAAALVLLGLGIWMIIEIIQWIGRH